MISIQPNDNVVRLSDLIAENYHSDFKMEVTHIVESGGRASTKSSRNALRVAKNMISDSKAEWIIVRQYAVHHADSTFKEMIIAFERLGLINGVDFRCTKSPMKIQLTATNQFISFGAMEDYEKLKGFKPSANDKYFRGILFFEITEFKSSYDMEQAFSTFVRGNKPAFNALYEFNPAPLKSHWTYKWLEKINKIDEYKIIKSTYKNLTKWEQTNWLGEAMMKAIDILKKYDLEMYKHIYLGKPRKLEGAIYARVFKPSEKQIKPTYISVGIDFGWTKSKTYIVPIATNYKEIQVLDDYCYDDPARDTESTIDEVVSYCLELRKTTGINYIRVIPENAEVGMLRTLEKRLLQYGIPVVDMGKKIPIEERITVVTHLLSLGVLHISKDLTNLVEALEEAVRDDKGKRLDDGTTNIDVLDALEYAMYDIWEYFDNLLSWKKGVSE